MVLRPGSKEVARWLVLPTLALAGCGLIAPTPLDAEVDGSWPCWEDSAPCAVRDAGTSRDEDAARDAAADLADAEAGAAACASDAECAADEYCSRVNGACQPRCDAQDGCIGPTIAASNNRIASDGQHICYADDGPVAGGPEYVVRSWDGSARSARALAHRRDARVLLVADGYCYFAAPSLERAPLVGGPSEPVQALTEAPRRAWLSADSVWWSAPRGDQLELYRLRRTPGAQAELVASGPPEKLWEGANSTHLFRREKPTFASCALIMAPIADLTQETSIPMSFSKNCSGALWVSEQSVLFTQFEPVHYYPFSVDLANLGVETTVRLHSQELLMYQVREPWVYGQSVVDGSSVVGVPNTVSYQRARLNGDPTERLFTPTPGTASYTVSPFALDDNVFRTFAVLDGKLVYQHRREFRLISVALDAPE
jgi:hypothetical protein